MNILNLPGWEVTGHAQTKTDYRIEAVYTPEPTACPECSTLFDRLYRHGKREQEIRDLPAHGKWVVIALTRKRYCCQGCGRTFLQPLQPLQPLPPLVRNRLIVDDCDVLVAAPFEPGEQPRGGTWSTVRYAKKAGKPVNIATPDGGVVTFNAQPRSPDGR